jgi:hypothetical protein
MPPGLTEGDDLTDSPRSLLFDAGRMMTEMSFGLNNVVSSSFGVELFLCEAAIARGGKSL